MIFYKGDCCCNQKTEGIAQEKLIEDIIWMDEAKVYEGFSVFHHMIHM